jgi:hypothetical protein
MIDEHGGGPFRFPTAIPSGATDRCLSGRGVVVKAFTGPADFSGSGNFFSVSVGDLRGEATKI